MTDWSKARERSSGRLKTVGHHDPGVDRTKPRQSANAKFGSALIPKISSPDQRPVVLVLAFGLDSAMLQQAATKALPCHASDPEPIFVIDHTLFAPLTKIGIIFEHFPSSTSKARLGLDLPWQRYAERRLDLLVMKWHPISVIPLGKISLALLSSWRARQHHPRGLPKAALGLQSSQD